MSAPHECECYCRGVPGSPCDDRPASLVIASDGSTRALCPDCVEHDAKAEPPARISIGGRS